MCYGTICGEPKTVDLGGPDDGDQTLGEIAEARGKSIVSLLCDAKRSSLAQQKSLGFLENLQCLQLRDDGNNYCLQLYSLDARDREHREDYLALSYTWAPSNYEECFHGRYHIHNRDESCFSAQRSEVRNVVLDRITKYMRSINVKNLWIDRQSIDQKGECHERNSRCNRDICNHKSNGLPVMDRVYTLSSKPVGLLGRRITKPRELDLLANLLQGKLTVGNDDAPRLSRPASLTNARAAMLLLREITDDAWWKRGWIFQEKYRAGTRMEMLILHPESLERPKRSYLTRNRSLAVFGDVDGELCFSCVKFCEETTRLCMAFERAMDWRPERHVRPRHYRGRRALTRKDIGKILAAAGKYNILLDPSEPMTPSIVADIEKRQITKRWDRLDITANCCQYSTRLDTRRLESKGSSLSISMLTLYLLNGEVLHNGRSRKPRAAGMTATEYLEKCSFKGIDGPDVSNRLTFNKSCRFPYAELNNAGIKTRGHVWRLSKAINTSKYSSQSHYLEPLEWLADRIRTQHRPLWRIIRGHLDRSTEEDESVEESFTQRYMGTMAGEVADAITSGVTLRLGALWTRNKKEKSQYRAIFVWDRDYDDNEGEVLVFTASRPKSQGSDKHDSNDLDRHVSFQVGMEGLNGIPSLRIKEWVSGLCFFGGCGRIPVIFPWPADLKEIRP